MAFILTDAGEYRSLSCPSIVPVGRGGENLLRPESQSVSKQHAIIYIEPVANTSKIAVWIEDLNSRNGTFVGESPLDFERLGSDRKRLQFGDYIRFGHSQKFFRLVDKIPAQNRINMEDEDLAELNVQFSQEKIKVMDTVKAIDNSSRTDNRNLHIFSESPNNFMNNSMTKQAPVVNTVPELDGNNELKSEDFNVMLRYNSKAGSISQPVTLLIGNRDTEIQNAVKQSNNSAKVFDNQTDDKLLIFNQQAMGAVERSKDDILLDNSQVRFHENNILNFSERFVSYSSEDISKINIKTYLSEISKWLLSIRSVYIPSNQTVSAASQRILGNEIMATSEVNANDELELILQMFSDISKDNLDILTSEIIAETLDSQDLKPSFIRTIEECMTSLDDLLHSCTLGARSDSNQSISCYEEIDAALVREMLSIIAKQSSFLETIRRNGFFICVSRISNSSDEDHLLITKRLISSYEVLLRCSKFLELPNSNLSSRESFEVLLICLKQVLAELWLCYHTLLCLVAITQEKVQKHIEGNQESNEMLDKLQRFRDHVLNRNESGALQVLKEIRSNEVRTAGQQFASLSKLAEIAEKAVLRGALRSWISFSRFVKRRELQLFEAEDSILRNVKAKFYRQWLSCFKRRSLTRKVISRFCRAIRYNAEKSVAIAFIKLKKQAIGTSNLQPSLVQLRLKVMGLQADLEAMTSTGDGALLAAERALNKELLATNASLRESVQDLEFKLLEHSDLPFAKRQELVYNYLISKEDQLSKYRKDNKVLKVELEQFRNSIISKSRENLESRRLSDPDDEERSPNSFRNPTHPSNYLQTSLVNESSSIIPKSVAKQIVLNEVRRLKESLQEIQSHRDSLSINLSNESKKSLELELANKVLSERMIEMERSAILLRELLVQRLGSKGVMELVEAMTSTGSGAHILLNCIVSPNSKQKEADPSTMKTISALDGKKYKDVISNSFFQKN